MKKLLLILLAFTFSPAFGSQIPNATPFEVVSQSTNALISALGATSRDARTPGMITSLVEKHIVPMIDQRRMAMGSLGKHWLKASKIERQEFIEAFRERQIKAYSRAFRNYHGQVVTFGKTRLSKDGSRASITSQVVKSDGSRTPIEFKLYKNDQTGQWLIYDARISGLGLLKTYRSQVDSRLQQVSLPAYLTEIKTELQRTY